MEINRDSVSSGERKRISPNQGACSLGLRAPIIKGMVSRTVWKVRPQKVKVPYAKTGTLYGVPE